MKPEYWDRAKRALRRKDAVMSSIMQRHKGIYLVRRGEPFLSLARMRKLGESWRPWRSVATWYLWRSLDPVPVEY